MAALSYLDTHVVVWLAAGEVDRLSRAAAARVESDDLLVSPAVGLELQFLLETKRITAPPGEVLGILRDRIGVRVCDAPFEEVVTHAFDLGWTRDPFDRLIVGHARARRAALITKDRTIRRRYPDAVW